MSFPTALCLPYLPKPHLRARKPRVASGAYLDRHMGVWCRKDAHPKLLRTISNIFLGHIERILRDWGCLHVPDAPPPSHNVRPDRLNFLAKNKNSVAEPIISYETAVIWTTTPVEVIIHPFGTCMKGFEVVCNVFSYSVMLAIPAQNLPQSPKTKSCQWGLPGQAYG